MKIKQGDIERLSFRARAIREEVIRRLKAEVEDVAIRNRLTLLAGSVEIFTMKRVLHNVIQYGTLELPVSRIGRSDRKKVLAIIDSL